MPLASNAATRRTTRSESRAGNRKAPSRQAERRRGYSSSDENEKPWNKKQHDATKTRRPTRSNSNTASASDCGIDPASSAEDGGTKRTRADISASPAPPKKGGSIRSEEEDSDGTGGSSGSNSSSPEDKENITMAGLAQSASSFGEDAASTPTRPSLATPYWKVVEERGTVSPKLTRSAAKAAKLVKQRRDDPLEDEQDSDGVDNIDKVPSDLRDGGEVETQLGDCLCDGTDRGVLLLFSPPDEKKNRERERREMERREKERQKRIANARASGHYLEFDNRGNPNFDLDTIRSPPRKKRSTKTAEEEEEEEKEAKEKASEQPKKMNECKLDMTPVKNALPDVASSEVAVGIDPPTSTKPTPSRKPPTPGKEWSKQVLSEIADVRQLIQTASLPTLQSNQSKDEEDSVVVQDLIAKNEKHVATCAVLEERTRTLQAEVDEAKSQLAEALNLNAALEKDFNEKLDDMKEECREKARDIEEMKDRLQKETASMEEMRESLKGQIAELEKQLDEKERSLEEMKWKVASVEENLHEEQRAKQELNALLEETAREKVDLAKKYDDAILESGQTLGYKADELDKQTKRAIAAEESLQERQAKIEVLESEVQTLRSNLDDERKKAIAAVEEERQAVEMQVKLDLQNMTDQNAKLSSELAKVWEGLKKAQSESEQISEDKEKKETELRALVDKVEDKLRSESEELSKSNQVAADLKTKLAATTQELQYMTAENDLAQKKAEEAALSFRSDISNFEEQAEEMRKKLKEYEARYGHLEHVQRDFEETKMKLAGLEKSSEAMKLEKTQLATRLETFEDRETELLRKLTVMDEKRRCLHNRVLQLAGNIRVFVRVRPTIPGELETLKEGHKRSKAEQHSDETPFHFPGICDRDVPDIAAIGSFSSTSTGSSVTSAGSSSADDLTKNLIELTEPFKDRGGLSARRKKWRWGFDNVFTPSHDQEDVWDGVEPLVQSTVDGFNVCLFAYGQTGSGKTHTMIGDSDHEGIMVRAVRKLFEAKSEIEAGSGGRTKVEVAVEMLEVYNERVRDLLTPDMKEIEVKTAMSNEPVVGNVLVSTSAVDDVMQILSLAQQRRCVKATKSNAESSRSHFVFTMHFDVVGENFSRSGKLHVCDLAGSERLSKSGSMGTTLKETKHINKSLSCLSNVIEKLQAGNSHVPYRESKLTYLLKDSLGGDSKTLAIVCCNPLSEHFNESLCSIRFAAKASRVELKAANNFSC